MMNAAVRVKNDKNEREVIVENYASNPVVCYNEAEYADIYEHPSKPSTIILIQSALQF